MKNILTLPGRTSMDCKAPPISSQTWSSYWDHYTCPQRNGKMPHLLILVPVKKKKTSDRDSREKQIDRYAGISCGECLNRLTFSNSK